MPEPRPYPNPDAISRVNGATPGDPGDDLAAYRAWLQGRGKSIDQHTCGAFCYPCIGAHRVRHCGIHPPRCAVSAPTEREQDPHGDPRLPHDTATARYAVAQVEPDGTFIWDEWVSLPEHITDALNDWAGELNEHRDDEMIVLRKPAGAVSA
jgi:hypothetical protein